MKLTIAIIAAIGLGLTCTASADDYGTLAAKGYRWVSICGPRASTTERGAERLSNALPTQAQTIEDDNAYYMIRGTIVRIIEEDAVNGMSEVQMGGLATYLWTYSRFLSREPIRDIDGVIETP